MADQRLNKTKESAEHRLEAFETFPFLLGNLGWGRFVVLVEVRVGRSVKIVVRLLAGIPRLRLWLLGRFSNGLLGSGFFL